MSKKNAPGPEFHNFLDSFRGVQVPEVQLIQLESID